MIRHRVPFDWLEWKNQIKALVSKMEFGSFGNLLKGNFYPFGISA